MPDSIAIGIPGIQVPPGSHVCAFYRGLAERDEIMIPYVLEGLRAGDKCIVVVDATDPGDLLAALAENADLDTRSSGDQLAVQRSLDTYLRDGGFSTESMLDFWDGMAGNAISSGFRFIRAVGEMTWSLRQLPGVEELVAYESHLNRFLPRYPAGRA